MKVKHGLRGIIAVNKSGYIGLNGQLPWKSSEDLKHFKELTMGCNLLVGYNTSKTLPDLIGREIFIDDGSKEINCDEMDWCIGGQRTYEKYCHLFTEIHISTIDDTTIGDVRYPNLSNLNPNCKFFYYSFGIDK